jgi:hypothetical protein
MTWHDGFENGHGEPSANAQRFRRPGGNHYGMSAGDVCVACGRRRINLCVLYAELVVRETSEYGVVTPELQAGIDAHQEVIIEALRLSGPARIVKLNHLVKAKDNVQIRSKEGKKHGDELKGCPVYRFGAG